LPGLDPLSRSEDELEDDYHLRVEAALKQLVFPDEPITLQIEDLDDEGAVFWATFNFRCAASPEAFVAAIYDLVWEENYFIHVQDMFCARAYAGGVQMIELTDEDFDADGELDMQQANVYESKESLRQAFGQAWHLRSQRPWRHAWETAWKRITATKKPGDPWLCVRRLAAQIHQQLN
jgi:hypothetical protein